MADNPTPDMLRELRRLHQEATDVARSHDEYLTLMFLAAVEMERQRQWQAAIDGPDDAPNPK